MDTFSNKIFTSLPFSFNLNIDKLLYYDETFDKIPYNITWNDLYVNDIIDNQLSFVGTNDATYSLLDIPIKNNLDNNNEQLVVSSFYPKGCIPKYIFNIKMPKGTIQQLSNIFFP